RRALDAAFVGAGDPARANARAIAVVHAGRLLVDRGAAGFEPGMPLHGWSMTKTLVAMLADRMAADGRLDLAAPVVVAAAGPREPAWLAAWRTDARARITVEDLLRMRDGLDHVEDYGAGGSVARMLYGQRDVAAFAAAAPVAAPSGERWRYLSASTNLLSRVLRARFPDDVSYLAAPRSEILEPIGARTITVGTDLDGTFVGSSFGWASAADWARLGELTRLDGRWGTRQVLAPGWLARASRPARPDGEGRGYGAQIWRIADPVAGRCRGRGLPDDTLAMQGYGGQIVAIVPSREAVVVRLGYSFDRRTFDECGFVADVLSALR
ncbi:MAG: serine hydrolase domain-containing protein, partial [Burkholderiales bacterium]